MRTIINNSLFCLLAIVAATLCGCSDSIFEDEAQNDGGSIRLAAASAWRQTSSNSP